MSRGLGGTAQRPPRHRLGALHAALAWALLPLWAALDIPLSLACALGWRFHRPRLYASLRSTRRRRHGLCLVLPGIEGSGLFSYRMVCGVARSGNGRPGFRGQILDVPWGHGWWPAQLVANVTSKAHRQRWTARLVRIVRRQRRLAPRKPIIIVAHSAGAGLLVELLEALAATARQRRCVDLAVLLAPSISPTRDLSAAARAAGSIVTVAAPADWLWLGIGTTLAGTCDRSFSPSAGLMGLHTQRPDNVRLRWWTPADVRFGFLANHCTAVAPAFVSSLIADHGSAICDTTTVAFVREQAGSSTEPDRPTCQSSILL